MKNVLCFGDSNTYGTPPMPGPEVSERFDRDIRWPGAMAAALGAGWNVIEEGCRVGRRFSTIRSRASSRTAGATGGLPRKPQAAGCHRSHARHERSQSPLRQPGRGYRGRGQHSRQHHHGGAEPGQSGKTPDRLPPADPACRLPRYHVCRRRRQVAPVSAAL